MRGRLLLTTDAVGGVWRYSVDLAGGLAARGVECVLAVLGPAAGADKLGELHGLSGVSVVQTGLPLDWTAAGPDELAASAERLAALSGLVGATGAHVHAPALIGEATWPVTVAAVAHSCVGTWWRAVRGGEPPDDFRWRIAATEAGLRRAAAMIVPTAAHGRAVQAVYGVGGMTVVRNGAGAHGAEDAPGNPGFRARAALTAGRLWDEGKKAASLDRVANGLGAPIRAAGPVKGPNGASVALPNLTLLGELSAVEMAQAYRASSVFASFAAYEPFGLSVLEAARSGMRLALSDIPSFRELWDGAAVFAADEAGIEACLRQALDASDDGAARARAMAYSLEAMTEGVMRVHERLGTVTA